MHGFLFKAGFISLLGLLILSCGNNPTGFNNKPLCPSLRIIAFSPYTQPIWSANNQLIGFNYTPLEDIIFRRDDRGCIIDINTFLNIDSSGFWLINVDGSAKRRVFPHYLEDPAWSPDGNWIAFDLRSQIFKMRFNGTGFDSTSITQLTFKGGNFEPTWSPDGQWIAYGNGGTSNGNTVGVWISPADGSGNRRYFTFGGGPDWSPKDNTLVYANKAIWVEALDHSFKKDIFSLNANDMAIGHIRYSPDGFKIAFWRQKTNGEGNIWIMNATGGNLHQVTFVGATDWVEWSPDGQNVVWVYYKADDFSFDNGILWITNINTGSKRQLTFNPHP